MAKLKIKNPFTSIHIPAPKAISLNQFTSGLKSVGNVAKSQITGIASFAADIETIPLKAMLGSASSVLGGTSSFLLPILAIGGCIIAYGFISKKF